MIYGKAGFLITDLGHLFRADKDLVKDFLKQSQLDLLEVVRK